MIDEKYWTDYWDNGDFNAFDYLLAGGFGTIYSQFTSKKNKVRTNIVWNKNGNILEWN